MRHYRYGFNGKENDNEVKGQGNQQDYGMRIYDTRLGRFLSVDPITDEYPELTPYQFASNTPIMGVDLDGLELKPSIMGPQAVKAALVLATYIYLGAVAGDDLVDRLKGKGKYIDLKGGVEFKGVAVVGDKKDISYVKKSTKTLQIKYIDFKEGVETFEKYTQYADKHPDSKQSTNDKLTEDRNTKTAKEERELVTPPDADDDSVVVKYHNAPNSTNDYEVKYKKGEENIPDAGRVIKDTPKKK